MNREAGAHEDAKRTDARVLFVLFFPFYPIYSADLCE